MYGDFKWECTEKDEPKGTQTTLFLVTAVLDIAAKHAVHDRTDSWTGLNCTVRCACSRPNGKATCTQVGLLSSRMTPLGTSWSTVTSTVYWIRVTSTYLIDAWAVVTCSTFLKCVVTVCLVQITMTRATLETTTFNEPSHYIVPFLKWYQEGENLQILYFSFFLLQLIFMVF